MRVLLSLLALLFVTTAEAADCKTDLKPTDTYKELSAALKCLDGRIKELEAGKGGGGAQPAGNTATAPAAKAVAAGTLVQEAAGFRFELESCSQSGQSILCRMYTTATLTDKHLFFSSQSRAVDENGAVYQWESYRGVGEEKPSRKGADRDFIKDVRTAAEFMFQGQVPEKASALSALQINFSPRGSNEVWVTFRNVPLR